MDGRMIGLTEIVLVGDDVTDELELASSRLTSLGGTVAPITTHSGWLGGWVENRLSDREVD